MKEYVKPLILLLGALVLTMGFQPSAQAGGSGSKMVSQAIGASPYAMRGFSIDAAKRITFSNEVKRDARVVLGFRDSEGRCIMGHPVGVRSSQTGDIEVPEKAERLKFVYIDTDKERMYHVDGSHSMIGTLSFTANGLVVNNLKFT